MNTNIELFKSKIAPRGVSFGWEGHIRSGVAKVSIVWGGGRGFSPKGPLFFFDFQWHPKGPPIGPRGARWLPKEAPNRLSRGS